MLRISIATGLLVATCPLAAQTCNQNWSTRFASQEVATHIHKLWLFDDDGALPRPVSLFAGGQFGSAGGAHCASVARWDGTTWHSLGLGVFRDFWTNQQGTVRAAVVFDDDGDGPNPSFLYVGGDFQWADGQPASNVARWNTMQWVPVGEGLSGPVDALAVYAGPGGPASLYAGGCFTENGIRGVARFDGVHWQAVGLGISVFCGTPSSGVQAMAVYDDDGPGPNPPCLYVGGSYDNGGGPSIDRWDGTTWSRVGTLGTTLWSQETNALQVYSPIPGSPGRLMVGGSFQSINGVLSPQLIAFDGASWQTVPNTPEVGAIASMAVLAPPPESPEPAKLVVAGNYQIPGDPNLNNIGVFDGQHWTALGNGVAEASTEAIDTVLAVPGGASIPQGVYAGGTFSGGNGAPRGLARWDGNSWGAFGNGLGDPTYAGVVASAVVVPVDLPGLPRGLYAAGRFKFAAGSTVGNVARWDGSQWQPLGSLGAAQNDLVRAIVLFDPDGPDGPASPTLYAAGSISTVDGQPGHIARWNGTGWSAVTGGPTSGIFYTLAPYEESPGVWSLYVGGSFATTQTSSINITRYDGSQWAPVTTATGGPNAAVRAMLPFDDGVVGPALYLAGEFTQIGSLPANRIAAWKDGHFVTVGAGMNNLVRALTAFDPDGAGPLHPRLYAGGSFTQVGATPAACVASWDGETWSAVGSGLSGTVNVLYPHDDGGGLALYAGGSFTAPAHIAKLSGNVWTPLESGLDGNAFWLGAFSDGVTPEPALYIGGDFLNAGGVSSGRLARWGCRDTPTPCYANCDGSTAPPVLNVLDFSCFLRRYAAGEDYANCDGSLFPPVLNVADFTCFLQQYAAGCP